MQILVYQLDWRIRVELQLHYFWVAKKKHKRLDWKNLFCGHTKCWVFPRKKSSFWNAFCWRPILVPKYIPSLNKCFGMRGTQPANYCHIRRTDKVICRGRFAHLNSFMLQWISASTMFWLLQLQPAQRVETLLRSVKSLYATIALTQAKKHDLKPCPYVTSFNLILFSPLTSRQPLNPPPQISNKGEKVHPSPSLPHSLFSSHLLIPFNLFPFPITF